MTSLCQKSFHALVSGLSFIHMYMGMSLFSFVYFMYICVHVGTSVFPDVCAVWLDIEVGTTCGNQFFPSTMWVTVANSGCQAW